MRHYRIANLHIAIDDIPGIPELVNFTPFAFTPTEGEVPDITYRMHAYEEGRLPLPPVSELDLVSEDIVNSLYLKDKTMYKCIRMQLGDPRTMWFVQTIGEREYADIYIPADWLDFIGVGNAFSLEKTLLPYNALLLHCALIEYEGQGIAFTAPSQTGKSTQAGLWEKHKGAHILNGDRAILRAEKDGIYAYGSPYAGSSDLFINRRVPLKLIVVLEQAKQNTIRPLDQSEGINYLIQQTSLPFWQEDLLEMGMNTLESILTGVPMHMLSCLPDEGAVECVYKCLKN